MSHSFIFLHNLLHLHHLVNPFLTTTVCDNLPLLNRWHHFSLATMTLAAIKTLDQSGNLCLPLTRIESAVCLQRDDWCQRCSLWKNEPGSVRLLSWISQGHFLKSINPSILSQSGVDIFPFHSIPASASHQTTLYEFIQHIYDTMQCRLRIIK